MSNLTNATQNCTEISNLSKDKLAGAFVLYNHAMILHNNLRLIEGGEVSSIPKLNKKVNKVDNPKFQGTLDMSSTVGGSMPKYGAKSFLITHETLEGSADMSLTFKSSGDLKLVAVRVKRDGSSNVNDNFVMDSSNQEYNLTEADRNGSLFVTLVNTTDKKISILELNLTKEILGVVIGKSTSLMWQDLYATPYNYFYGTHSNALYTYHKAKRNI